MPFNIDSIGWLEPLLETISLNYKVAILPVIDGVDSKDLHYMTYPNPDYQLGIFHWSLIFNWQLQTQEELNRRHAVGMRGNAETIRYNDQAACLKFL